MCQTLEQLLGATNPTGTILKSTQQRFAYQGVTATYLSSLRSSSGGAEPGNHYKVTSTFTPFTLSFGQTKICFTVILAHTSFVFVFIVVINIIWSKMCSYEGYDMIWWTISKLNYNCFNSHKSSLVKLLILFAVALLWIPLVIKAILITWLYLDSAHYWYFRTTSLVVLSICHNLAQERETANANLTLPSL